MSNGKKEMEARKGKKKYYCHGIGYENLTEQERDVV